MTIYFVILFTISFTSCLLHIYSETNGDFIRPIISPRIDLMRVLSEHGVHNRLIAHYIIDGLRTGQNTQLRYIYGDSTLSVREIDRLYYVLRSHIKRAPIKGTNVPF